MRRGSIGINIKAILKKHLILVLATFLIITIGIVVLSKIELTYYKENRVVIDINNESVTQREFEMLMSAKRAEVYTYFRTKYRVQDYKDFWTTQYGNEIPVEYLKKIILDEIIRAKEIQIIAKERGIIKDISFKAFLKELELENKRRSEYIKKGMVIYGPIQYSEREYFLYTYKNLIEELKDKLKQNELKVNDSEINEIYVSNKVKDFVGSEGEPKTYEEIKDAIKLSIINDKFDNFIDRLVKEAKVEIKQNVYNSIMTE